MVLSGGRGSTPTEAWLATIPLRLEAIEEETSESDAIEYFVVHRTVHKVYTRFRRAGGRAPQKRVARVYVYSFLVFALGVHLYVCISFTLFLFCCGWWTLCCAPRNQQRVNDV